MPIESERRFTSRTILTAVAVVVFIAVGVGIRLWKSTPSVAESVVNAAVGQKEQTIDVTAIVTKIGRLNRLETASMRVINVTKLEQSYGIIPNVFAGDELTLMAAGDVVAGIDLSRLRNEDVHLGADGVVTVVLPRCEVLVTRLDNKETRVIDRKTGMLRSADLNLEGRAREYAETNIREEAIRKGVLDLAATNAEMQVGELMNKFGVARVRFERERPTDAETPRKP